MDIPVSDKSRIERELSKILGADVHICQPQSRIEWLLAWLIANGTTGVTKGYFDATTGKFYKDEDKTEEITGEAGKIYFDQTGGKFYFWNGTAFAEFGTGGGAWGQITGNIENQTDLMGKFNDIDELIPEQASAQNQLADKEFTNSSIATNTAHYIYKTVGSEKVPFDSVAELEAYSGTVTPNDYAFVTGTDTEGNTYYDRYKASVSGSTVSWAKEYRLNNSSFTAAQWAAIQSGITAALVGLIGTAVQPEDYATTSKGGTVKVSSTYGIEMTSAGLLRALVKSLADYTAAGDNMLIGKGTLENVLTDRVQAKTTFSCLMADGTTKTLTLNGTLA